MSEKTELQATERDRFELLKKCVTDGLAICFIVGSALREIKERKFYLADGHEDFEAFCDAEWGWTKRYCNQLILDAAAINSLPQSMRKLITSHKAAEELARIPEMLRLAVVSEATNGGKKAATASAIKKAAPAPPPRKAAAAQPKPPVRKAAVAAAKPVPKGPKDKTGLLIPAESLALWNRSADAQGILTYLSAIRGRIKKAQDDSDILFVEVDYTDDLAKLNQVIVDMERALPYAVCPTCQGKLPAGCLTCKERGFVSEYYWKMFVPEETKALREKVVAL